MVEILIRKAIEEDHEELMKLYSMFAEDKNRYVNLDNDSFIKFLNNPDSVVEIAMFDDKNVGFIAYSIRDVVRYPKPILQVEEIFVVKEFRGMKIGKELMDRALKYSEKMDCQHIFTNSNIAGEESEKFYKDYGFNIYGTSFRKKLQ